MLAILAAATVALSPPQLPTHSLTPGKVDPAKTLAVVCVRGFTAQPGVRNVTDATKRAVFAAYHVNPAVGGPYEVDHLISLELGGSNDAANLWPQSYTSKPYNAHLKDALEDRLHALVCPSKAYPKPRLGLAQAQAEISGNWITAYVRYFPAK